MEEEKHIKHNIGITCAIILAISLVILTAGFLTMRHVLSKPMGSSKEYPGIERISEVTGVRFPRNAKLWNSFSYTNGPERWMYLAQVEINKSDVEEFISLLPKVRMKSNTDRLDITDNCYSHYPTDDVVYKWWKPDSSRSYIALRVSHPGSLKILITMDHPQRAVVYVICHN